MECRSEAKDLSGIMVDYTEHVYGKYSEEIECREVERPQNVGLIYRDRQQRLFLVLLGGRKFRFRSWPQEYPSYGRRRYEYIELPQLERKAEIAPAVIVILDAPDQ